MVLPIVRRELIGTWADWVVALGPSVPAVADIAHPARSDILDAASPMWYGFSVGFASTLRTCEPSAYVLPCSKR